MAEENDKDQLDEKAQAEAESIAELANAAGTDTGETDSQPVELPDIADAPDNLSQDNIDLLKDVDLNVKIELGRSQMLVEHVLRLTSGSVVELDKLAGDPVDVLVNEQLVARGEVLVVNDNFCVRINEIIKGATDRLASL